MWPEVFRIPIIDRPVYGYGLMLVIRFLTGTVFVPTSIVVCLARGRVGCVVTVCCCGEECALSWAAAFHYGANALVEQYEKRETTVPPELTDPTRPLASGLPRLLNKEEI